MNEIFSFQVQAQIVLQTGVTKVASVNQRLNLFLLQTSTIFCWAWQSFQFPFLLSQSTGALMSLRLVSFSLLSYINFIIYTRFKKINNLKITKVGQEPVSIIHIRFTKTGSSIKQLTPDQVSTLEGDVNWGVVYPKSSYKISLPL